MAVIVTILKRYPLNCFTSKIYVWTSKSCFYDNYKLRYQYKYMVNLPISETHFKGWYQTILLIFSVSPRIHSCYPPDMHCRGAKDIESIKNYFLTFHAGLGPKIHFVILTIRVRYNVLAKGSQEPVQLPYGYRMLTVRLPYG